MPLPARPSRAADEPLIALHTGGTTGQSRLFWKSANHLLGEAAAQREALGLGAEDVVVTCVPPNHIYGLLFSVLAPLLAQARVVAVESPYPEEIAAALARERATVLVAVPAHYRALAATELPRGALRVALSSAAPLNAADARLFHEATGVAITEIYGSTETGGVATRSQARGEATWRAIAGVDVSLEAGRLWVRSPYVSSELRDERGGFLTADRALPGEAPSSFELVGRSDGVVKVGGVRVELGDVREALLGLPGITDAYVLARTVEGARAQELVALFVGCVDPGEVRRGLSSRLTAVAVPRLILKTANIPAAANGKIERERVLDLVARASEGNGP